MPRLFENLSVAQLQALLAAGHPEAPLGHLTDPAAIRRAKRLAKTNGVLKTLDRDFDPAAPILALKLSAYRDYKRTGSRAADNLLHQRRNDILLAAMALWLDHPKASVMRLQDVLWTACDDFTWVAPAHENSIVDLTSSMMAASLCEVLAAVGHRLDAEVVTRVGSQIESRVLTQHDHPSNWWRKSLFNWNHVCNANIIRAALYLWHDDPKRLAELVHRCVVEMQLALDGFTDDGGCEEGPGYWIYGFGHYVAAAYAIHAYTAGKINLMTVDPKIARISRFPLATHIEGNRQAPFADTSHTYLPANVALTINRLLQIPELYSLCRTHPDRRLALHDWTELAMYQGQKAPKLAPADALLPDMGLARIRSAPGKHQLTVLATAGHNGANHNHNDIGSFVAYRDGVELITDPGGPIYTAKTFSDRRYEIFFCNSLGHPVPLINGQQQGEGKEFTGQLTAEGIDQRSDKSIRMEMAHAYPAGTVESLVRTLNLDYASHSLTITDAYRFAQTPKELAETFITYEPVRIARNGKSLTIGSGTAKATLTAAQPGRFKLIPEIEASKEGRTNKVVNRILFSPAKLTRDITLSFVLA